MNENENGFIRKVSIQDENGTVVDEREIKVDSDHVDMSTYSESTTAADSLTKKIHDLEEATPDLATSSTPGIVKPGSGLKMATPATGQDPDGTMELDAATLTVKRSDGTTVVGTYDGSRDVEIVLPNEMPQNHASTSTIYGIGDSSKYGHVKIEDGYTTTPAAPTGTAFSITGAHNMYEALKDGNIESVTQAQYDALTPAQKNNGKIYMITDSPSFGTLYVFRTKAQMDAAISAGTVPSGAACFVKEDTPYVVTAGDVIYSNTISGLDAVDAQEAIDEVLSLLNDKVKELDEKLMYTEFKNITTDFNSGAFSAHPERYKPGNYILKAYGGVTYAAVLCDYNYYYNPGRNDYANVNINHWVAIVLGFAEGQMNTEHVTTGGFIASLMNTWLKGDCTTAMLGAFGQDHLIKHDCLLSNGTYNAADTVNHGFNWEWEGDHYTMLPTEEQLFGTRVMSDGWQSIAESARQLKIFQDNSVMAVLGRDYGQTAQGQFNAYHAWERDIAANSPGTYFCLAACYGVASGTVGAAYSRGRFPLIILK